MKGKRRTKDCVTKEFPAHKTTLHVCNCRSKRKLQSSQLQQFLLNSCLRLLEGCGGGCATEFTSVVMHN